MWRKTACAVGGALVACAALYGLSSFDTRSSAANFDLRWLYPATKTDRLPLVQMQPVDYVMMAFNIPSSNTTIATKGPTFIQAKPRLDQMRSFAGGEQNAQLRVRVRIVPVNPVRTVPAEEKKDTKEKERLPVGCEPAFSPVTTPAMAHVSSRCDA